MTSPHALLNRHPQDWGGICLLAGTQTWKGCRAQVFYCKEGHTKKGQSPLFGSPQACSWLRGVTAGGGQALLPLHGDLGSHSGEQAAAEDHTGGMASHDRRVGDPLCPRVAPWLAREQSVLHREPGTG